MIRIAGTEIAPEHALDDLRDYAERVPDTLLYYDYDGDLTKSPVPDDEVQQRDIARLVVINARLAANDVGQLLRPLEDPGLWEAVPKAARFEDLPDDPRSSPTYQALVALSDAYDSRTGLGSTKVSKLLHLKRPLLMPVLDSVALAVYEDPARLMGEELGSRQSMFWAAIWRDARANSDATGQIAHALSQGSPSERLLGALSPLRLHDALVWKHFNRRSGCLSR